MRNRILLVLVLVFAAQTACAVELPTVTAELKQQLLQYLRANHQGPEEYVINKFKEHDVVILGEYHRIRHDPELIQNLIPRLYKAGIYTLAIEFLRREDQPLIDRLLSGGEWDEALGRQIQFNGFVFWGYREYVDIYKAAWRLNRSLPLGSRPFRVLGIGDSPDWSLIKTEADARDPAIRRQVWRGGGEHLWAKVILDEVARKEKVLVYCGLHHAFSEYRQPIFDEKKQAFIRHTGERMGNHVYKELGKRVITIALHAPWIPAEGYSQPFYVYPVEGAIDAVIAELEPRYRRAGFDTRGTPFGRLPDTRTIYKHGYPGFTLATLCDGYIIQKPMAEYESVTMIPDFINEHNIDTARMQSPNVALRTASIKTFMEGMAQDADFKRRLQRVR